MKKAMNATLISLVIGSVGISYIRFWIHLDSGSIAGATLDILSVFFGLWFLIGCAMPILERFGSLIAEEARAATDDEWALRRFGMTEQQTCLHCEGRGYFGDPFHPDSDCSMCKGKRWVR